MLHPLPVKELNNDIISNITFKEFVDYEEEEEYKEVEEENINFNDIPLDINFENQEKNEILETMRSLPDDYLVLMIVEMIHNSLSFPYTKFINMLKCGNTSILIAPSIKDKNILLRAIIDYLTVYTNISNENKDNCIEKLVEVYNQYHMDTIKYNTIPFIDLLCLNTQSIELWYMLNINFINKSTIKEIKLSYKNKTQLPEDIINLIKLQMFIFASVYIDMDELLVYLYKTA